MSAQPSKPPAEGLWTIRTEKGATFGPATLDILKGWARDGRVAPTSEASRNGTDWVPVTALGLDMDWIAEVSPATFYGPIHRNALEDLIREGSLKASAATFRRERGDATADAARAQAELQASAAAARRDLRAQAEDFEKQIVALQRSLSQAHADLKARDHEFDAERQELRAAQNRIQAESVKKDGRIAALESENAQLQGAVQDGKTRLSRAEELEASLAQIRQEADEAKRQADLHRDALRHAELDRASSRAQAEQSQRELEACRSRLHAQAARLENARRLSQQLSATLAAGDEPATEDAVIVAEPAATLPPIAPPAGKKTASSLSLADIEAQAQRELRQMGEHGNGMFKRPRKA